MAKIFAAIEGASIRLGNYGTATFTDPVDVPSAIADELVSVTSLRVERETEPANPETKAPKSETIAPRTETKPAKGEKE